MKTIKHIAQAAILVVLSAQALAHEADAEDLTKAERGRVEVSKCYAACHAEAMRERSRFFDLPDWVERAAACEDVQLFARAIDACRSACVDLEGVYGVRTSHARNRFLQVFSGAELQRETRGLWVDYRNSPERGTPEFDAACDRFFGDPSSEAGGSVFAKPKARTRRSGANGAP